MISRPWASTRPPLGNWIFTFDQSSIQLPSGGRVDAQGLEIIQGGRLQLTATAGAIDLSTIFPSYNLQFVNTSLYLPASSGAATVSFGTSIPTFFSQLELNNAGETYDTLNFSGFGAPVVMTVDPSGYTGGVWIASGNTTFANLTGFPNMIGSAYGDTLVGTVWGCTLS